MKKFIAIALLFLVVLIIYVTSIFIKFNGRISYILSPNACTSIRRTFEYAGCSTNYSEEIEKENFLFGKCTPCRGMHPCVSGFYPGAKIKILKCLCDKGTIKEAKDFASHYMSKESYTVRRNLGHGFQLITYPEQGALDKVEINDVCNHIPAEVIYM